MEKVFETINIEDLKSNMNMPKTVKIFDTTLRDGEQAPGISLTVDDKINIAKRLDTLGVDTIEIGFPVSSEGEKEAARRAADLGFNATLCGLARTKEKDINAVINCNLPYVHTFIATSPLHRQYKLKKSREEVISTAVGAVEYAKDHGLKVEFSAEDATRTELDFLLELYKEVENAGADVINVPDTVGILVPPTTEKLIREIKSNINVPVSLHFHNDFGLAVANSIVGIEQGASQVHCTINGIGERGGNASLEELAVSLKVAYNMDLSIDTTQLYDICNFVGYLTGIKIPPNKPVIGENAFAHEAGIHVDGILKNAMTYEPISPEVVGHKRRIALGKHTGHAAIKSKLDKLDIELTEKQLCDVYNQVKALGDKGKKVSDIELQSIAISELSTGEKEYIKLLGLNVITGESVSATATVKLEIEGEEYETAEIGVGPVDAAVNAIKELVNEIVEIKLEEYRLEAVTGGTDGSCTSGAAAAGAEAEGSAAPSLVKVIVTPLSIAFSSVRMSPESVPLQSRPEPLIVNLSPSSVHFALPFSPSMLIAALPLSLSSMVKPSSHRLSMLMLRPFISPVRAT